MYRINRFITWLVTSSEDPLKVSLTLRAAFVVAGAWLLKASVTLCGLGLYCLGLTEDTINQVVNLLTNITYGIAVIVGSMAALYGLVRKWKNGRWSAA